MCEELLLLVGIKICSLSLAFDKLIVISHCFAVELSESICLDFLQSVESCLMNVGSFGPLFLQIFFSSSLGIPMLSVLIPLVVPDSSLKLYLFFFLLFSFCSLN